MVVDEEIDCFALLAYRGDDAEKTVLLFCPVLFDRGEKTEKPDDAPDFLNPMFCAAPNFVKNTNGANPALAMITYVVIGENDDSKQAQ